MGTARRIFKNMFFLGAAEIISKILQFVLMIYAARLLGKSSFGKFSFALSLSLIAMILADLGIHIFLIREVARNKNSANKYFINAFAAKFGLALITYVFIVIFINVMNYPKDTRHIAYVILIFAVLSSFTDLYYSIFRAFEKMFYDSLIKVLRMVILTSAGLYALFRYRDALIFSFAFILAEALMLILAYFIASKKFIKIRLELDKKFIISIIRKSLPFGLALAFGAIYFYIGSVMLSKMRGDIEVAVYSAAYNLVLAILFIPTVYTNAIYPVMSRYFKTSKEGLVLIYKKSFKYLYIIGLPISIGSYVLADRIIVFFYGKEYISSIIVLQVVSLYIFIKFLNFLYGYVLSSINQQNKRMLSQGSTAVFNIAANFVLIPKMGYVGAAIASLITEVFLFVMYYWNVSKLFYMYNFLNILAKPLIASIGMVIFIKSTDFGLVLTLLMSTAVYSAAIFLLRTFDDDDYKILNKMLKRFDGKIQ